MAVRDRKLVIFPTWQNLCRQRYRELDVRSESQFGCLIDRHGRFCGSVVGKRHVSHGVVVRIAVCGQLVECSVRLGEKDCHEQELFGWVFPKQDRWRQWMGILVQ